MSPRYFLLSVIVVASSTTACGSNDRWVDTLSGDCTDAQIEETKQNPELFAQVGERVCSSTGAGRFAGEFRCSGSTEDGTRKMEVRCSP
jgi:hypothetical protein